jgi:hypothetical protein
MKQSNLELELKALKQLKQAYKEAIKMGNISTILEIKTRLDLIQEQCFLDLSAIVLKKVG